MKASTLAQCGLASWCTACLHVYRDRPIHETVALILLGLILLGAAFLLETRNA